MRWLNPAALAGLLALVVPILVHLFGRRVARRQRFPTLRLLHNVRPTPATRSRPSDLLLLLLRCSLVMAAVAALAQPLWSTDAREAAWRNPVRAILVDTSASIRRLTSDGTGALQRARARAREMLDSAREGIVFETDRPGDRVGVASSWLEQRSGLRELVIISDFQRGAIVEGSLAPVLKDVGIRLLRVASGPVSATGPVRLPGGSAVITLDARPDRTDATWVMSPAGPTLPVTVLAGDGEEPLVQASLTAARAAAGHWTPAGRDVAVVFPNHAERRSLIAGARSLDAPWQGDLVVALHRDPTLAAVARAAIVAKSCEVAGVAVAHNADGDVIAAVARGQEGTGGHELLIFSCVEPGSMAGTALLAGVAAAVSPSPSLSELEPAFLPDETLRLWERPSTETGPRHPDETSPDGRWLWLAAILLLVLEEWVRRIKPRPSPGSVNEVRRARVA